MSNPETTRSATAALWVPLISGFVVAVPAGIALLTGLILLFPSLGPTALMQTQSPELPAARPYNVIVGHVCGIIAAYLALILFQLTAEPSVFEVGDLTAARAAASVVAIVLTAASQALLRASHPPAAATTLLISLGAFKLTGRDALMLLAGIAIVAIVGELFRRFLQTQNARA